MNLDVEIAEDGRLACEMAEKSQAEGKPFDLILMDVQMPKMNGYEATQWLRQHGWKGPIVALTAHALVGDREKCLAAGCDDYIAKPITAKELRDRPGTLPGADGDGDDMPEGTAETPHESAVLLQSGILDQSKVAVLMDAFREELPARRSGSTGRLQQGDALSYSNWHTSSKDRLGSTALTTSPQLPTPYAIICGTTSSCRNSKPSYLNWWLNAGRPPRIAPA